MIVSWLNLLLRRMTRPPLGAVFLANVDTKKFTSPLLCLLAPAFLLLIYVLARLGLFPAWLSHAYLFLSLTAFSLYLVDKRAAREGRWRIRERTLHLAGLLGGWPGAFAAQRLLRHKTQKASFVFVFRFTVLGNCALLALFAALRLA